jgi:predicted nucleic acid-binding protein
VIVYFDTSALVKRYVIEADSEAVTILWEQATMMATSQILYGEVAASFARKRREQPENAAVLDQAQQTFRKDWSSFYRIAVDDEINRRIEDLLSRYVLRGADAIHLASALLLRDLTQADVTFACSDNTLRAAAQAEHLTLQP